MPDQNRSHHQKYSLFFYFKPNAAYFKPIAAIIRPLLPRIAFALNIMPGNSQSVSKISRSHSLIIHHNQLYRQKNSFCTHTRDSALMSDLLRVKAIICR